jgi:hypothetical protein
MEEADILNLEVILQHYDLPTPQVKDSALFFREICRILIDKKRNAEAVDCSCVFDLLHCLWKGGSDTIIEKMIQLIAVTSPSESGLRRLCEMLRGGGGNCFSLGVHPFLYKKFCSLLAQDALSLVKLPGDINSYINLSSLPLLCPDSYTLTMWYKIDESQSTEHEIRLFRCRTIHGGIECLMQFHDSASQFFRFKLKSYISNGNSDFVDFDLKIVPNGWNFLAIAQRNQKSESSLELFHNGSLILQNYLPYPFGDAQAESNWSFGSGLRGACGGIALYRDKLTQSLSQFLFEGGPSLESLHSPVSIPLSSTESAGVMLGTSHTKGEVALLASKSKLLYIFTPNHFVSTSFLPTYSPGKLFLEFMELSVIDPRVETTRIPILTGLCEVESFHPWSQAWLNIGGTTTLLYLFWDYLLLMKSHPDHMELIVQTVFELLGLVSTLIRCSVNAREKFIQEHGFHILSAGFRMVGMDQFVTNLNDFEYFKTLISATLSSTPQCGDELAAVFQGFLFDFDLWGSLRIDLRIGILQFIISLSENRADVLYESIGIQKLISIMDRQLSSIPDSFEIESAHLLAIHFSDVLLVMIRYSLQSHRTATSPASTLENLKRDISLLVTLLEVSCCSLTIERILSVLHDLRNQDPALVEECLYFTRFADTAALRLLCSVELNFSLQVRRDSFLLFLWQLMQTLRNLPSQLLKGKPLFGQLHLDLSRQKPKMSITGASAAMEYSRLEKELSQAISAIKRIKEKVTAIEKVWILVNMFGCELNEVLPRAGWPHKAADGGSIPVTQVLDLFDPEGPLGAVDPLILLPFLLPMLSRCPDCTWHLRFLRNFRAKLQDDESSLAVLSLLPENAWLGPLSLLFNLEIPEVEIRQSCFEIILEVITEILVYRLKHFGGAVVDTLKVLFASLDYKVESASISLLPQILLLSLQQVQQIDSKGWSRGMLIGLAALMSSVEEQQICGNKIVFRKDKKQVTPKTRAGRNPEAILESQSMIQALVVFLEKFKTVSVGSAFGPREVKVVLPIIRIFMGCIQACVNEEDTEVFLVDDICVALVASFPYMSEQWRYFSPEAFCDMIMSMIHEFRSIVESQTVPCNLRDRCTSVVLSLIQYYAQHETSEPPVHLQLIINTLRPVQHCTDIESVFHVLFPLERENSHPQERILTTSPSVAEAPVANNGMIFTIKDDDEDEDFEETLAMDEMATPLVKIEDSQSSPPDLRSVANANADPETGETDENVNTTGCGESVNNASVRSQVLAPNPLTQAEISQRHYFQKWRALRTEALQGKQEAERLRSARMDDLASHNLTVTKNYFKTLRGKIQLEIFLEDAEPEWKLGVSHEGSFPARRRVLLRPKYSERSKCLSYDQYTNQENESQVSLAPEGDQNESNISAAPELDKILLQSSPGAIVDVISSGHWNPDPKSDLQSEDAISEVGPEDEDQQSAGLDGELISLLTADK